MKVIPSDMFASCGPDSPGLHYCESRHNGVATIAVAAVFGLILLSSAPAMAQRWQIRPNANVSLSFDDNVRTTAASKQGSLVSNARGAVRAMRSTENSQVALAAGASLQGFADAADLDNTSGFLGLDSSYRGERNRFRLGASLDTQSTLTSEAATTGLTQVNKQRYQLGIRPGWTFLVSERASLDLALSYTDVFYEDIGDLPLFNYRQGNLRLAGSYRLTERAGLNIDLDYSHYEAQGVTNETDNFAAQIGADYLVSETVSLGFLVGLRQTRATFEGPGGLSVTEKSTGPSYRLNLSKQLASGGGISLQAIRSLVPSGSAELLDTTGVTLGISHPFSERWRLSASGSGFRNRQPGGESSLNDRKYATGRLTVGYALSEDWNLSASYRHRWQQRDELQGKAHSNSVFLTLAWSRPWDL